MRAAEDVGFGGGGLDRRADLRARSADLFRDPAACAVPVWRGRPLVAGGGAPGSAPGLHPIPAEDPMLARHGVAPVFLGEHDGAPLFAVDVSRWDPDSPVAVDAGPGRAGADQPAPGFDRAAPDARFADLRALVARLSPIDAEIAATARGVLEWHRTHGFCARCGAASTPSDGGWRRECPACGGQHFPRTDPVVIMLVTDGNRLLVGRSPGWPEGFYSLLAGFMEPGETVAAAVRREVAEEAGVEIGAVRMLASQPWPFPASLMIGCQAEATSRAIRLDPTELEDALWIGREELLRVFAGRHPRIGQPRAGAIAHFLMKLWLADRLD